MYDNKEFGNRIKNLRKISGYTQEEIAEKLDIGDRIKISSLTSYNTVGKNLRNDICHYNNNIKEICTYENVLEVIYILLTISNELLLKIIEKK